MNDADRQLIGNASIVNTNVVGSVGAGVRRMFEAELPFELRVQPVQPATIADWSGIELTLRLQYGIGGVTYEEQLPVPLNGGVFRRIGREVSAGVEVAAVANSPLARQRVLCAISPASVASTYEETAASEDIAAGATGPLHRLQPFVRACRIARNIASLIFSFHDPSGAAVLQITPATDASDVYSVPTSAVDYRWRSTAGASSMVVTGFLRP